MGHTAALKRSSQTVLRSFLGRLLQPHASDDLYVLRDTLRTRLTHRVRVRLIQGESTRFQHDVFGLYVAVDDALVMSGLQSLATLGGDSKEVVSRNGPPEAVAQGLAFDVLHDKPEFAGVLDHVVDGAKIGVVEGGGALGFLEQALAVGISGLSVGAMCLMATKRFSVVSSAP
jgi:hypothetical protein